MTNLKGKAALVTGGSRGIGAAIAMALAEAGADLALTFQGSKDRADAVVTRIESKGGRAVAIRADSADAAAVTASVDEAASALGRLDILVVNAGIVTEGNSLEEIDRILAVNTRAPYLAALAAEKHMTDGGRIITIGSCLGEAVRFPGITLYSMSKAAITGMTRGLARDLGPRGITVNVVQPGPIDTDMNPASGPSADGQRALTALGRYGRAEEVAAMVAFLAGPGGAYVTGAQIAVDGGTNA
ncbi:MAG TPA: SDR family oxidoreductase [Ferrovibrio sp.]|jgi:3-oxoacyl-[acyl-carrier protein] reductase|uniref:SDR family oxidoreductase n=1 Tax=Ferrovibrio sp. TaxID=1917215 RepID=UPI002B4B92CB|nr:SDR family oxidoreductase [Ferrovibrio sp.]HLT77111.1 SDR family oxidoreductase [Ferrovibrio sp.]